jgi:hypothetical protein
MNRRNGHSLFPFSTPLSRFGFISSTVEQAANKWPGQDDSREKLPSECLAANADFASHSSIEPLGPSWSQPEGTL